MAIKKIVQLEKDNLGVYGRISFVTRNAAHCTKMFLKKIFIKEAFEKYKLLAVSEAVELLMVT